MMQFITPKMTNGYLNFFYNLNSTTLVAKIIFLIFKDA